MHKRSQMQDHQKRSKKVILLFILDMFFLVLSFFATIIQSPYSQAIALISLSLAIFILFHAAVYSIKTLMLDNNFKDYFFIKNSGTSLLKVKHFHKLMDENLFRYNFQPIVNAKTGEVFAYEALMRTDPDSIDLLPLEILDLAAKDGRLYEIENFTLGNALKLRKEYSDIFGSKKLFINSISSHQLNDGDFNELYSIYHNLFPNIVLEITDATSLNESSLGLIHKRMKTSNCQLALDDYGTGYATENNLVNSNPEYVKIDRSMMRYINVDTKKQSLVSNLINLAKQKNIKVIAVGIESYEELEYAIHLGVDYVQGFYIGRPEKTLMNSLAEDIVQKIQRINYKKISENSSKRMYETNGASEIILTEISSEMYYSIIINEDELVLKGSPDAIADISILIPDNHSCRLTFDNLTLRSSDRPSIILGNNSSMTINLVGDNHILNDGIRVMETGNLQIVGDGNLSVHADRTNRVGIGGTDSQTFGNITLASTGSIKVVSAGNITVGIGGGQNTANSVIRLLSGNIEVETRGYNALCVGSILGNSIIEIDGKCNLKTNAEGTKAVGVGSLVGAANIQSSGTLNIRCDGRNSVGIGSLDEGYGSITIMSGMINIRINTHIGVGIGAISGQMLLTLNEGDLQIFGEGTELAGLGDQSGKSEVRINGGLLAMQLFANNSMMSGTFPQKIIINGGNIQCDFPENTIPINSYGSPLVSHIITNTDEFSHIIETVSYHYEYKASYSSRYPFIKVYLPEYSTIY